MWQILSEEEKEEEEEEEEDQEEEQGLFKANAVNEEDPEREEEEEEEEEGLFKANAGENGPNYRDFCSDQKFWPRTHPDTEWPQDLEAG